MSESRTPTSTTKIDLTPGQETSINNPNPANMEVRISTAAGSVIKFTVPARGSFSVKPNGDLTEINIDVDFKGYGPRPAQPD
ncbi:hypothetical protein [Luteimonas fraxinea]|uniref:MSP domain-containing protein n=1 Tax=Luteimonas fraxinea TaxID=2901869 RepID=A0ABS8U9P4_9GAMM|nr:hypothetical protein [Luteimonas fraxinea]MCD9096201.1 hypothetical protein [Luteimonas fraxinea]